MLGNIVCLVLLLLRVEHIEDGVGTAHKVWMVRIDVGILHNYKILHHFIRWLKAIVEQLKHLLVYFLPQFLESSKLWHLDLDNDSSKLLKDKLDALETRGLQPLDLLL